WQRIREATLEGKLAIYNKPTSTFRRFDRAEALPRDYLPIGDVISSVNPIFGQGMAVALGHVHALRAALRAPREEWQRLYLEGACSWSNRAWRRALAYDRTFLFSEQEQARNLAALRALARARQQKAHG